MKRQIIQIGEKLKTDQITYYDAMSEIKDLIGINKPINFFSEAKKFLDKTLTEDFDQQLETHIKELNLNENELRLFGSMVTSYIDFKITMLILNDNYNNFNE